MDMSLEEVEIIDVGGAPQPEPAAAAPTAEKKAKSPSAKAIAAMDMPQLMTLCKQLSVENEAEWFKYAGRLVVENKTNRINLPNAQFQLEAALLVLRVLNREVRGEVEHKPLLAAICLMQETKDLLQKYGNEKQQLETLRTPRILFLQHTSPAIKGAFSITVENAVKKYLKTEIEKGNAPPPPPPNSDAEEFELVRERFLRRQYALPTVLIKDATLTKRFGLPYFSVDCVNYRFVAFDLIDGLGGINYKPPNKPETIASEFEQKKEMIQKVAKIAASDKLLTDYSLRCMTSGESPFYYHESEIVKVLEMCLKSKTGSYEQTEVKTNISPPRTIGTIGLLALAFASEQFLANVLSYRAHALLTIANKAVNTFSEVVKAAELIKFLEGKIAVVKEMIAAAEKKTKAQAPPPPPQEAAAAAPSQPQPPPAPAAAAAHEPAPMEIDPAAAPATTASHGKKKRQAQVWPHAKGKSSFVPWQPHPLEDKKVVQPLREAAQNVLATAAAATRCKTLTEVRAHGGIVPIGANAATGARGGDDDDDDEAEAADKKAFDQEIEEALKDAGIKREVGLDARRNTQATVQNPAPDQFIVQRTTNNGVHVPPVGELELVEHVMYLLENADCSDEVVLPISTLRQLLELPLDTLRKATTNDSQLHLSLANTMGKLEIKPVQDLYRRLRATASPTRVPSETVQKLFADRQFIDSMKDCMTRMSLIMRISDRIGGGGGVAAPTTNAVAK